MITLFLLGLVLGSFANVCIHRIPRDESVVHPPSHCPSCGAVIPWYHNIPLISYLVLRGKCAGCGVRISLQYPAVELITGLAFLFLGMKFGMHPVTFFYAAFALALIIISGIDFRHQVIPDVLVYIIFGMGIISSFFNPLLAGYWGFRILNSVLGAASGLLLIMLIMFIGKKIFKKDAMGSGDAKLLAGIGAFLGPHRILAVLFIASVFGSLFGLFLIITKRIDRKDYIPFGPFLALAAYLNLYLPGAIFSFLL
jgi:leader peptidase (prepilin peptidase) / N-methyltransferase